MSNDAGNYFLRTDQFGLVAGTCNYFDIVNFADKRLQKNSNNQTGMSNGMLLMCMIINALGFAAKPLYLFSNFFDGVDTQVLFGDNFDISKVNDDSLGRMLDALYEYGIEKFYLEFGNHAMERLGYKPEFIHLDSTSFHLHGDKYNNEEPVRISITGKTEANKKEPVKMVQGYSRDAHPELPQVMMQMIVENQAGIPLFMKPQNGNTNDSDGFAKSLNEVESLLTSLKKGVKSPYLVCDAALYTADNLKDIYASRENRIKFITRAPSKIKEVEGMIKRANADGFEMIRDQYSGRMYDFSYADVPQKILVVKSDAALEREGKTIDRRADKELKSFEAELKKLERKKFSCSPDARKALQEIEKKHSRYSVLNGEPEIIEEKHFSKPGRRKKDAEPDSIVYRIKAEAKLNNEAVEREKKEAGCFVIATNDTQRNWTMEELLDGYKSQQRVERGFRFLKDPEFFADSIFLKTPERIEALLMVMVTTLFVYSATEYLLRKNLKEKKMTVSHQTGKPISNPTMRWILMIFDMKATGRFFADGKLVGCSNLTKDQQTVVEALGDAWTNIYRCFLKKNDVDLQV